MTAVLDCNVLLRFVDNTHPQHAIAAAALAALRKSGPTPVLVPQALYEFWVVATRPTAQNGLGLDTPTCDALVAGFVAAFPVHPDGQGLLAEWRRLVVAHDCKGKPAHDVRYVASMSLNGFTHILTFNGADFARYPGIIVLDPATVAVYLPPGK